MEYGKNTVLHFILHNPDNKTPYDWFIRGFIVRIMQNKMEYGVFTILHFILGNAGRRSSYISGLTGFQVIS